MVVVVVVVVVAAVVVVVVVVVVHSHLWRETGSSTPPQFWWFRVGGIHVFSFKTSKHCRNLKVIVSGIPSVYTLGTKVKEYTAVLQGIPAYPAGKHDYKVKVRVTSQPSPILTHIKGPEQLHANLGGNS